MSPEGDAGNQRSQSQRRASVSVPDGVAAAENWSPPCGGVATKWPNDG